jgi:hypothetical protein
MAWVDSELLRVCYNIVMDAVLDKDLPVMADSMAWVDSELLKVRCGWAAFPSCACSFGVA